MSSDSVTNNNKADLSGALSSLNIIGDVELASACANVVRKVTEII